MRLLPLLLLTSIIAAEEAEPAKLATDDAMPVDPGRCEVALGLDRTVASRAFAGDGTRYDRGGRLVEHDASLGIAYGLGEDLDCGLTLGYAWISDAASDPPRGQDFTDPVVAAKWRFWHRGDDERGLALALVPELSLPAGEGNREGELPVGSRLWGPGLSLAASVAAGPLSLAADVGRDWVQGTTRGDLRGTWHADLACGWQVADWLQPEVELHHVREATAHGAPAARHSSATVGVEFTLGAGRIGIGVDRAFAGRDADQTTTILLQVVRAF